LSNGILSTVREMFMKKNFFILIISLVLAACGSSGENKVNDEDLAGQVKTDTENIIDKEKVSDNEKVPDKEENPDKNNIPDKENDTDADNLNIVDSDEPEQNDDDSVKIDKIVPAFPGAEGFGSDTIGGRGGQVTKVTNTNDSGPGSLRYALEEVSVPRIVVFETGGLITLDSNITIKDPYVTIAGQTAPGDGIAIRSATLSVETHDVIVRNLRFRVGDLANGSDPISRDGIQIYSPNADSEAYNVIIDHCSVSWGVDENISTWTGTHDITIQRSISSEGLYDSIHPDTSGVETRPHSMGALLGQDGYNLSFHHNLMAHNRDRNPKISGIINAEVVNNVIYDWIWGPTKISEHKNIVHILNNYYKQGSDSRNREIHFDYLTNHPETKIYVSGNYVDPILTRANDIESGDERCSSSINDIIVHNAPGWCDPVPPDFRALTEQFLSPLKSVQTAQDAYLSVLADVGATIPVRDSVDLRIIDEVLNRTGSMIDSQADRDPDPSCKPQDPDCGWPTYGKGTPLPDTDNDGMPDSWEIAQGLNLNIDDSALDSNGDGYTNIENYINSFFK